MMVNENSYKKCYKYYNKTNTGKSKHIEYMIHYFSKGCIYSVNPSNIKYSFYQKSNPKDFFMNNVENYEKREIDEWKKKHIVIILSC